MQTWDNNIVFVLKESEKKNKEVPFLAGAFASSSLDSSSLDSSSLDSFFAENF